METQILTSAGQMGDRTPMSEGKRQDRETSGENNATEPAADPISLALRKLHETVVAEEVPEDILNILAEIDRKLEAGGDSQ